MTSVTSFLVQSFIRKRFPEDCNWTDSNCHYFAVILKERFPEGEICYDVVEVHFVLKLNGEMYDTNGHTVVPWKSFSEYDEKQRERILRDYIL